ncbi:15416_t:CDS:2, partial [Racocetra persica]
VSYLQFIKTFLLCNQITSENKYLKDNITNYNHDKSNKDNLDTQDYSENKVHPKDDTANNLNEPNSNNEFAALNE